MPALIVSFLTALAGALFLTPVCERIARKTGFLAQPSARGVHRKATPLLGGAAIFVSFTVAALVGSTLAGRESGQAVLGFLGGGALIFVMGIIDDRIDLSWFSKLLGQIVAAVLLLASGSTAEAFYLSPIGLVLALFWIVGLTNAMNFLDNMDGISTGIAAVISLAFAGLGVLNGRPETALLAVALCGASLGFLRFNFPPARIFLGDGGSLFLGYSLASLGLMATHDSTFSLSLLVPVIALAYPIFDITFVSVTRAFRGQSLTEGGKDHSSHRLGRILGGSRATAWTIYRITGALGIVSLVLQRLDFTPATLVAFVAIVFAFLSFGIRLSRLAPVPEGPRTAGVPAS